jgi:Tol biopolymer transport system component
MRGMTKAFLALLASAMTISATVQNTSMADKIAAIGRINFVQSPALSPDGSKLAYLSNASGSPQLWRKTLATGDTQQITNLPDPLQSVQWSPDGQWLAYDVAPGGGLNAQIWLMRPDGTGAKRLTAGGKENNFLDGWTDDSRFLRIDTNQKTPAGMDAMLVDPATGTMRAVVTDNGMNGITDTAGDWASVTRLVGRGDNNLYAVHLKSGAERPLTPHDGKAQSGWGQFGNDGKTLYVMSDVGRDRSAISRHATMQSRMGAC